MEETILQAFDIKVHGLLLNTRWQIAEYESPTSECGFVNTDNAVLFALVDKKSESVLIEGYLSRKDRKIVFSAGVLTEELKSSQVPAFVSRLQERMNIEFSSMHPINKIGEYQ